MAEPARIGAVRIKDGYTFDGLANIMTGAGTSVDKRMASFYTTPFADPQQIEAAYRSSWLARKVVDLPAQDMTREWRDWQGEGDAIGKIETLEKKIKLRAHILRALKLGKLGGGAIYIAVAGDMPNEPLDPTKVKPNTLAYLVTYSRWQLTLEDEVTDPSDPLVGGPRFFGLNTSANNGVRIHPSRMIVFKGAHVPMGLNVSWQDAFWGDPVYVAIGDAIRNADSVQGNFASLIDEAKYDVFGIPGLLSNLAQPGYEAQVLKRLALATQGKSQHRSVVIDKDESWDQHATSWSGMPEIGSFFLGLVAGAADIPVTRLLGQSAKGLNATGVGDERDYLTSIASRQESDLRPALEIVDAVMMRSAGIADPLPWFEFAPLFELSETERATVEKSKADTAKIYADSGLVPIDALSKAVQNGLIEDGTYPGLEEALESAAVESAEADDPNAADDTKLVEELTPKIAANDAAPRSLYVSRPVLNRDDLQAWATKQGLGELQPDLHVTIMYSRTPIDWMNVDAEDWNQEKNGQIEIAPGGVRIVEPLGDRTAVLLFTSSRLSWRHQQILNAGADFDFADYQPHISLKGEPVDLSVVEPYRGKIVLGPEVFEEVKGDGK